MTNVTMADTPLLAKLLARIGQTLAPADRTAPVFAKNALGAPELTLTAQGTDCMKDMAEDITGLETEPFSFIEALKDQHSGIAAHALNAWDGGTLDKINGNLEAAKTILLQIVDAAGANGFAGLGAAAQACTDEVTAHLEGPDADLAICPGEIIYHMDLFVAQCRDILDPTD